MPGKDGDARDAPSPSADQLVLGRYRMAERLGAGGFGVVWRAQDEAGGDDVAVKRIVLHPGDDGERAQREATAVARLEHPAVVELLEAGAEDGCFYIVSELVRGPTLATLNTRRECHDEQVLEIGRSLADALEHAHARGVIHRDVKPHNVLVPDPRQGPAHAAAKLADFGGARVLGERPLTRSGDVVGTLAYMAPEQAEGREVGEEADLYALALVLYEALSGVQPVRGVTPAATVRRIGQPIAALSSHRPDLPGALTGAIDRALAAVAWQRGCIADLRRALDAGTVEGPPPAAPQRSRTPRTPREPEPARGPAGPISPRGPAHPRPSRSPASAGA